MSDLRFAFRQLLNNPGFTAVAVLTLALGIGANTAIFSVVNAVLLRPFPYENPDRLVWIWENNLSKNIPINPASPGNLKVWRQESRHLEKVSAWEGENFNLTDRGEPARVLGAKVFADFLDVLGIQPVAGRFFRPDEDRAGADPVVLLSHGLWQRRFGGDTNILGGALTVDGRRFTVIGIMPAGQAVPFNLFELWMPFALDARRLDAHGDRFLRPLARLKSGVTVQEAQAELTGIAGRLEQRFPEENTGAGVNVIPLKEMFTGEMRAPLLVLLGAVGFVLLIACANVANLMLARAATREREIALRAALGATRFQLTRQLLAESLLLCALGTAAGLILAAGGVQFLRTLIPTVSSSYKVSIPGLDQIVIDRGVLLFTIGLTFVTALLCGLGPALKASRLDLIDSLRARGGATGAGTRPSRLRSLLVVSEVALALVLLAGAGLMVTSFRNLRAANLGFDPRQVLSMTMALPEARYPGDTQRADFYQQLLERVTALPGTKSAAVANYVPLSGHWGSVGFVIEGRPALTPADYLVANTCTVSPEFFHVMGIPVLDGRGFAPTDRETAPQVVVINQTMARRFWPGENPLGKRLDLGEPGQPAFREIVGVAGDVRHFGPEPESHAQIYFPLRQSPGRQMSLIVRTATDPLAQTPAVVAAVRALDAAQPVYDVQTMEQLVAQTTAPRRFAMQLLGAFAVVALLLGGIGIYGVVAWAVSRRTHEIGVRMALGARHGDVLGLVVRQGMTLALLGVGTGLAGALAATRVLQSLLFEINPFDPRIFLLVTAALITVAFLACWLPARRAMRIDPLEALRHE